jgi:hypothetical protein
LAAIHRIEPWEEPEPIVRMDPLTRGSLFHRIQAEFFRELQAAAMLPVTAATLRRGDGCARAVVTRVAQEYAEQLAPAIERVWRDEVDEIRRDLIIWLQRMAGEHEWIPEYFEFSFGLNDDGRDPRSVPDPIELESRFVLRGSVDLIERHARSRNASRDRPQDRPQPIEARRVIGGGFRPPACALQPGRRTGPREKRRERAALLLHDARRLRSALDSDRCERTRSGIRRVDHRGSRRRARSSAGDPQKDACRWCDFQVVCGPDEERRVQRSPKRCEPTCSR